MKYFFTSDSGPLEQLVGYPSGNASMAIRSLVSFSARRCPMPNYFRDSTPVRSSIKLAPPSRHGGSLGNHRRREHELAELVARLHLCGTPRTSEPCEQQPRRHPQGHDCPPEFQGITPLHPDYHHSSNNGSKPERNWLRRRRSSGGHRAGDLDTGRQPNDADGHRMESPSDPELDESPIPRSRASLQGRTRPHDAPRRKGPREGS